MKNFELLNCVNLIMISFSIYASVMRKLYIPVGQIGPVSRQESGVRWQEGTSVPGTASLGRVSGLWRKPCVPSYVFEDRHCRQNLKKKNNKINVINLYINYEMFISYFYGIKKA